MSVKNVSQLVKTLTSMDSNKVIFVESWSGLKYHAELVDGSIGDRVDINLKRPERTSLSKNSLIESLLSSPQNLPAFAHLDNEIYRINNIILNNDAIEVHIAP